MAAVNQRIAQNERIGRRIPEELATGGDRDLTEELYAMDAVERSPFEDHSEQMAIRKSTEDLPVAFSDFSATVEEIIAEGVRIAMRVTPRGTHEGEFLGADPTGRKFEVGHTVFSRLDDGMVVGRWVQPDTFGLLQQPGIRSVPTEYR